MVTALTEYKVYQDSEGDSAFHHRHTYGVALYQDGACQRVIGDISGDRKRLEKLVRLFNAEALDPVHLDQAVEDFLFDFAD